MDTAVTNAPTVEVPPTRGCTRCQGVQHLLGANSGFGKYRCDTCELTVGFDLEADPSEFLLHRGSPGRYTAEWFGPDLAPQERRLTPLAHPN